MTQNGILTILFVVFAMFFIFGMIGDRDQVNRKDYALCFMATIISIALINLF